MVTYVVSAAWVGMTSFCAVPIIMFLMLRSICLNEVQHWDYWYLDNYCINMSRFGQLLFQFSVSILMMLTVLNKLQICYRGVRTYAADSY